MASEMKMLQCEQFRLTVEFDEKDFKRTTFMREVVEQDRDGSFFSFNFPSKASDEHAHAYVSLDGAESTLNVNFVVNRVPHEDLEETGPHMEEAAQYLSSFFKKKKLKSEVFTTFEYGQDFSSVIQLDYPVLIAGAAFSGARVVGHDVIFPKDSFVNTASISALASKGVLLFLFGTITVDLRTFNLYSEIKRFGEFAEQLVRRKESNVKPKAKR